MPRHDVGLRRRAILHESGERAPVTAVRPGQKVRSAPINGQQHAQTPPFPALFKGAAPPCEENIMDFLSPPAPFLQHFLKRGISAIKIHYIS